MSTTTVASDLVHRGPITSANLVELGKAFEAWSDPSAYEPTYEELVGPTGDTRDLDAALEMRSFAL